MWGIEEIQRARLKELSRYKNFFIFDIETIPDEEMVIKVGKEDDIEKLYSGDFLQTPYHRIVAVSHITIKDKNIERFESFVSEDEGLVLNYFWESFRNAHKWKDGKISEFTVLITVNGKSFDVPVIISRSLKHVNRIKYKFYIGLFLDSFDKWEDSFPRYSYRYSMYHIDIPEDIFNKKISLKNLCYLCKIPVKTEGNGTEVKRYYENGEFEKIAKYCAEDVKATAMLFAYINEHFFNRKYIFPHFKEIEKSEPKINIIGK